MLKNLSVKTKVGVIVGVLAATVLAVAIVGARQLDRVTERTQSLWWTISAKRPR